MSNADTTKQYYELAKQIAKKAKSAYSKTELQGLMVIVCGYLHDNYLYDASDVYINDAISAKITTTDNVTVEGIDNAYKEMYKNFQSNKPIDTKMLNTFGAYPRLYKSEILTLHHQVAQIVSKFNSFFNEVFLTDAKLPTLPSRSFSPSEKDMEKDMIDMSKNSFLLKFVVTSVATAITSEQQQGQAADAGVFQESQPTAKKPAISDSNTANANDEDLNQNRPKTKINSLLIEFFDNLRKNNQQDVVIQLESENDFVKSTNHPYKYSDANEYWIFTEITELQKYALFFSVLLDRLHKMHNSYNEYTTTPTSSAHYYLDYEKYIAVKGQLHMSASTARKSLAGRTVALAGRTAASGYTGTKKGIKIIGQSLGISKAGMRTRRKKRTKNKRRNNKLRRKRFTRRGGGLLSFGKAAAKYTGAQYIVNQGIKFADKKQPFDDSQVGKYEFLLFFNYIFDLYINNAFKYDIELEGVDNTLDPNGKTFIDTVETQEETEVKDTQLTLTQLKKYYDANVPRSIRTLNGMGEIRTKGTKLWNIWKKSANGQMRILENAKRMGLLYKDAFVKTLSFAHRNGIIGYAILACTLVSNAATGLALVIPFPPAQVALLSISAATSITQKAILFIAAPILVPSVEIIRTKQDIIKKAKQFVASDGTSTKEDTLKRIEQIISGGYDVLQGLKTGSIRRIAGNDDKLNIVNCNFGIQLNNDDNAQSKDAAKLDFNEQSDLLIKEARLILEKNASLGLLFNDLNLDTKTTVARYYLKEMLDYKETTFYEFVIEFNDPNTQLREGLLETFNNYISTRANVRKEYLQNEMVKYKLLLKSYYLSVAANLTNFSGLKDDLLKIKSYIDFKYNYHRVVPRLIYGTNEYLKHNANVDNTTIQIYNEDTNNNQQKMIKNELKIYYKKQNSNLTDEALVAKTDIKNCFTATGFFSGKTQAYADHCRIQNKITKRITQYIDLHTFTNKKNGAMVIKKNDATYSLNTSQVDFNTTKNVIIEMILYSSYYFNPKAPVTSGRNQELKHPITEDNIKNATKVLTYIINVITNNILKTSHNFDHELAKKQTMNSHDLELYSNFIIDQLAKNGLDYDNIDNMIVDAWNESIKKTKTNSNVTPKLNE